MHYSGWIHGAFYLSCFWIRMWYSGHFFICRGLLYPKTLLWDGAHHDHVHICILRFQVQVWRGFIGSSVLVGAWWRGCKLSTPWVSDWSQLTCWIYYLLWINIGRWFFVSFIDDFFSCFSNRIAIIFSFCSLIFNIYP